MHLPRPPTCPLRALGLLVAGAAAALALWVAASPPATTTLAPGAAELP